MLEALGLTEDEDLAYRDLVREGPCGPERLAVRTGLPPRRIEAALDGLMARGLTIREPGAGGPLAAQPPDSAGELLLAHRMQELLEARAAMMRLAQEYHVDNRRAAGPVAIEHVPKEALAARVEQIVRRARSEVLYFDTPPYFSVDNSVQVQKMSEGVVYRTLYCRDAVEYPGAMERIDQCVRAGEQARVTARLPMKMMIVDREVAVLPALSESGTRPGATGIISPSPLLTGLLELFERVWDDSVPLTPGEGEAPDALDPEDTRLLTLLLSGLTDEAVARHLGIARRTVLRRARGLMDRAGVATRMQLGWYAARRGWIGAAEPS
ncbi:MULTISPECIES: helix-turn-helix domain-containing protein [unclassified Streptomyces]|uniref:helix-turn-helix domain-containing protein n=1 Tax=unclassified Streptomyces TaxID=2593676 RepID=UPI000938CD40|nr:helix-turn-helix domain-containing protein [Streptomyces sp. CB02058]